jgi:hypothetical protein
MFSPECNAYLAQRHVNIYGALGNLCVCPRLSLAGLVLMQLAADGTAGMAMAVTQIAITAAALAWMFR